jgi:hypothetical protein
MRQEDTVNRNIVMGALVSAGLCLAASAPTQGQTNPQAQTGPSVNRIEIAYLHPENPALRPYETLVKEDQVLEHVQRSMRFIELPQPIFIHFAQCDDDNAWYNPYEHTVTFCYELVRHIENIAPKGTRDGTSRRDAILGSVYFSLQHELGHAFIDTFEFPILGREEDAADDLAAYAILTMNKPKPEQIIRGAAWMWGQDARREKPDKGALADVHSLAYQRFFNLLCLAYGSDPVSFAFVERDLPSDRAADCKREFRLLDFSITKLFTGHVDTALLEQLRAYFRERRPNATQESSK